MKRMLVVLGILMLVFSLVGCDDAFSLLGNDESTTPEESESKFIIDAIQNTSTSPPERALRTSTRDTEEVYELWLMPTRRGPNEPIMHENMSGLKKFQAMEDGSYYIPISEFPNYCSSVVFIMQVSPDNSQELVGFLSLKIDESTQVIEFPSSEDMLSDVAFGVVTVSEDSYIATSQYSLDENGDSFTEATYLALQQNAIANNFALMALNILGNTHEEHFYAPSLSFSYSRDDASDVNWGTIGVRVYSDDHESIAALFDPEGTRISSSYRIGYGVNSSVQWSARLSLSEFLQLATKDNIWTLKTEDETQLAAFDLSVALVMDDEGNPIIPCIDPTYAVKEDDPSLVDRIDMNWFYYELDGTTKHPITPDSPIASLIEESSLYMDIQVDENYGTYMLRSRGSGGAFGMEGDIFSLSNFDRPLAVSELGKLSIGYRFTFYDCNTKWED